MRQKIFSGFLITFVAALVLVWGVPAEAQLTPQQRLLACRAAKADAYRQLAERGKGLRIESATYVRDFVAESDEIATALDTFIKGVRVVDTRELADGSCEVDVEVTIQQVEEELRRIVKEHYHGGRWHEHSFEKIHVYYNQKVISATGMGAPRPLEPAMAPAPMPVPTRPAPATHPDWQGVSPQDRLLARRAAIADAYRNMAERVKGLQIDSQTYVRDFVTESDVINTNLNTFIKGCRILDTRYIAGPICEVDVECTIQEVQQELRRIVKEHYHGGRWHEHSFDKVHNYYEKKSLVATGSGVPRSYGASAGSAPAATAPYEPEWATQYIRATGSGVPPEDVTDPGQAGLLAERAAEIDAKRNLLERIHGVQVDSATYVRDYAAEHDEDRRTEASEVNIDDKTAQGGIGHTGTRTHHRAHELFQNQAGYNGGEARRRRGIRGRVT
jgi:hypothetical protein